MRLTALMARNKHGIVSGSVRVAWHGHEIINTRLIHGRTTFQKVLRTSKLTSFKVVSLLKS